MNGRCHEGAKCKFSHDTTPLTKSKPCCVFARHACMKGDDCPFDHELSKYPCNNYQTTGSCNRGSACMFSHEVLFTSFVLII
ncbi:putative transcription factor C3H family [Helianthus annuus]|uniref:Putative zinc finger, CCCH-type n=1 Tax=Helianthus annuus TaxID=4232 RepID=A0A251SH61_HELAN|nr:putative transcription factor C3H family [Helianthus annuus]KAJ0839690.1 putative transcription factor C3H family [Helianthus annuus]